jgi:hypothetical protein
MGAGMTQKISALHAQNNVNLTTRALAILGLTSARRAFPRSRTARATRAVRQRHERQERRTTDISVYQFVSLLATPAFFWS